MNHHTVDMYSRNRGTTRYGLQTSDGLGMRISLICPFCLNATTVIDGRIAEHREAHNVTRCPATGRDLATARRLAAQMTADYKLPGECNLG